jgi:hypothetical protein
VGTLDRIGRQLGPLAGAGRYGPQVEANMAAYRARYPLAHYVGVTNITDQVLLAGHEYTMAGGRTVTLLENIAPGGSGFAQ